MPWVRIDEEFPRHPKVVKAGPLGMAMHVAALCYCNQYLTDGFVPRAIVAGLIDLSGIGMRQWMGEVAGGGEDATWELVVQDLEAAGLWEREQGGWRIHDYHDYQPSREHVLKVREVRQEAGRKGGQAKPKRPESKLLGNVRPLRQATGEANPQANGEAESKPVPVPDRSSTTHPEEYSPPAVIHTASVENPSRPSQRRAKLRDPLAVGDALTPVIGRQPSRPTREQLRWREEGDKRAAAQRALREAGP
jgi:hypothetical protein